eukprot:Sspe_Gene.53791::Locus_29702_Transcript_1_1_Confidence_1.000_Length_1662::g.53791::m.53791
MPHPVLPVPPPYHSTSGYGSQHPVSHPLAPNQPLVEVPASLVIEAYERKSRLLEAAARNSEPVPPRRHRISLPMREIRNPAEAHEVARVLAQKYRSRGGDLMDCPSATEAARKANGVLDSTRNSLELHLGCSPTTQPPKQKLTATLHCPLSTSEHLVALRNEMSEMRCASHVFTPRKRVHHPPLVATPRTDSWYEGCSEIPRRHDIIMEGPEKPTYYEAVMGPKCALCGTSCLVGSRFCHSCGANLSEEPASSLPSVRDEEVLPRDRSDRSERRSPSDRGEADREGTPSSHPRRSSRVDKVDTLSSGGVSTRVPSEASRSPASKRNTAIALDND